MLIYVCSVCNDFCIFSIKSEAEYCNFFPVFPVRTWFLIKVFGSEWAKN